MKSFLIKLLFVFGFFMPLIDCRGNPYCSLCPNHTLCLYSGPGKACHKLGRSGVSQREKKLIVDAHNRLRSLVASGKEKRGRNGPQPPAANLMRMSWDSELEKMAQMWADQCLVQHDPCLKLKRWRVGQNLAFFEKYPVHRVNWTKTIMAWYDEVDSFDMKNIDKYRFSSGTGHYSAMLWHSTYAVGCGRRDYGYRKLYVCNYGPAGNVIGQQMYKKGKACSACPRKTKCRSNLCVRLYRDDEDRENMPESLEDYDTDNSNMTASIESEDYGSGDMGKKVLSNTTRSIESEDYGSGDYGSGDYGNEDMGITEESEMESRDEIIDINYQFYPRLERYLDSEIKAIGNRIKRLLITLVQKIESAIE